MSGDVGHGRAPRTPGDKPAGFESAQGMAVPGLEAAWCTHPGRVRRENEDAIAVAALPAEAGLLVVLSDGLGGHAGGEIASRIVCDRVARSAVELTPDRPAPARYESLREALLDADRLVRAAAAERDELGDMGATAVAVALTPSDALHLYAGDSRLYHVRAGRTLYRTQDQTVVGLMQQYGQLTEADAAQHPQRHRLLSVLGGGSDRSRCEPAPAWPRDSATCEAQLALAPGDTVLLCSDGLTGQVPDATIEVLLARSEGSASAAASTLVEAALEAGGQDNVTVCVIRVTEARAPRRAARR